MRFNKYLAMCFIASSLMCGSFTSCGDDDDDDNGTENSGNGSLSDDFNNGKNAVEQGRQDGKKFGEAYQEGMAAYEAGDYWKLTTIVPNALALSNSYNNSTDNVYKTAFAEATAEVLSGKGETGDAAMEQMNKWLENLSMIKKFIPGGNNSGVSENGKTEE